MKKYILLISVLAGLAMQGSAFAAHDHDHSAEVKKLLRLKATLSSTSMMFGHPARVSKFSLLNLVVNQQLSLWFIHPVSTFAR